MPLALPQVEQIGLSAAMSNSVPSNIVEGLVSAYVELHARHERIAKELDSLRRPVSDLRASLSRIKALTDQ